MIVDTKTYIETPRSRLTLGTFAAPDLIAACIADVRDLLLHYPPIVIFGKAAHQRRDVGFFSDESQGYRYSGQMAASQPLTGNLKQLMALINQEFGAQFNGILINRYNHGKDYISPHSDDERFLDVKAGVVAISSGAERVFYVRGKSPDTAGFSQQLTLPHMSVVHMSGDFQKEFTHAIPPDSTPGIRYSLTFRRHE